MKPKTQRQVCSAVLVLAAGAFGIDRWMFSGPSEAQGMTTTAMVAPAARSVEQDAMSAAESAPAKRTLAARLQEAAKVQQLQLSDVQDAFRVSSKLMPPKETAAAAAPVDPAVEFMSKHKLTAVMSNARGGMVMIDGKTFLPGQAIDGFTVVVVQPTGAVLRNGAVTIELSMDKGSHKNN
jgi:hypothetical protein